MSRFKPVMDLAQRAVEAFADAVLANKKSTGCSFREAAETQELIHTIFENNEK